MTEIRNELLNEFTRYWGFLALKAACKINLFDHIQNGNDTLTLLCKQAGFNQEALEILIKALDKMQTLSFDGSTLTLTKMGRLLCEDHPESVKETCLLWGEEHMAAWMSLDKSIISGKSSFEDLYGIGYFDFLDRNPSKLINYHKAMHSYAMEDYKNIHCLPGLSGHPSIMDVGGGLGYVISKIKINYPGIKCYLFDRLKVIALSNNLNVQTLTGNFFEAIPSVAEAIILARVIHDWDDHQSKTILENCYLALPEGGTIYLIENLTDRIKDEAALLSLNMLAICKSYERSEKEYQNLLLITGFTFEETLQLNDHQYVLKARKYGMA